MLAKRRASSVGFGGVCSIKEVECVELRGP